MSTNTASISQAADVLRVSTFSVERWIYVGVLLLAVLNVLYVPVFATQDGPLHNFYSQVFANLLQGDPLYSAQYHVKSLFPPYSAHLYLLIAVNHLTGDQFLTERIIAALAVICTFVGFAKLSQSITKGSFLPIGMCLPFLANWSLYMGFFNFTFGLGILMFTAGYWLDHAGRRFSWREVSISALLIFLLAAMHPIALAFFYLMAGMYIVFSILMLRTDRPDTSLKEVRGRFGVQIVFLLLAASMTYLWGRHFVDNRALHVYPPTLRDAAERFGSFFTLNEISPFGFTVWYTLPLLCVFLPCLVFAVRGVRSRWKDPRIATIAAMAAGCFLLYLVVPKEFNTAYHFHRRFSIFSILLILVLAGAWPATTAAWKRMAAVAVAAGLIATFAQNRGSESAIRDIKPALSAPILPAGSRIVEVRFGSYRYRKPLRYVPAMWASAYWAARSHATIMNMPWATQPYYPVQSNGQPDREPIDFGPLFLKAIDDHAPLPMAPDAVVVEMAVDHLDEQKRAIQALENEYGFKPISEPSIDLLVLARKEIRQ